MKILVIGSGGREHALVWKIAQSPKVDHIYCTPGNPGMGELAENIPIKVTELDKLVKFAKGNKVDLTIVGPEVPLILGIADKFQKYKLPIIGPSQKAAQIEGSKAFAKNLMKKYGIPTAKFEVFDNFNRAKKYVNNQKIPIVIKASGLAGGKGVLVTKNKKEAIGFLKSLMVDKIFGSAGKKIVIEECIEGQEVSFMVATDGKDFISLLPSQDHKRASDGDRGPNTGGMGAYAPVPFVSKKLIKQIENEIVRPTINALAQEGALYQGILYPGLILTQDGPKVLEFNCRFGDPETQPLMVLLKTDIIDIFRSIQNKNIRNQKLHWNIGSAVCVVLTSKGYPGNYEKGRKIVGLDNIKSNKSVHIFHSGTNKKNDQIITTGGRVLGITATGNNLKSAIDKAYKYIGQRGIHFSGMHFRKDIGKKGLKSLSYGI